MQDSSNNKLPERALSIAGAPEGADVQREGVSADEREEGVVETVREVDGWQAIGRPGGGHRALDGTDVTRPNRAARKSARWARDVAAGLGTERGVAATGKHQRKVVPRPRMRGPPSVVSTTVSDVVADAETLSDVVADAETASDVVADTETVSDVVADTETVTDVVADAGLGQNKKKRNRSAAKRLVVATQRRAEAARLAEAAAQVVDFDGAVDNVPTDPVSDREGGTSARRRRAQQWVDDESGDEAAGVEGALLARSSLTSLARSSLTPLTRSSLTPLASSPPASDPPVGSCRVLRSASVRTGVIRAERDSVTGSPVPVLGKRKLVPYVEIISQRAGTRGARAVNRSGPKDRTSNAEALKRAVLAMAAVKKDALQAKQNDDLPPRQRRRWNAEAKAAAAVEKRLRPARVDFKAKKILHGNLRRRWHKEHFPQQNEVVTMGKRSPKLRCCQNICLKRKSRLIAAKELAHCLTIASFHVGQKTTSRQLWSHWGCLKQGQLHFHRRVDENDGVHVSGLGGFNRLADKQKEVITATIVAADQPGPPPPDPKSAAGIARKAKKAKARRESKQKRSDLAKLGECLATVQRRLGKKTFANILPS
ncbi:predicted protein [Postia placenta Mad-698-R]|nr:predicted protein [Postia placenta Mad-698-R]